MRANTILATIAAGTMLTVGAFAAGAHLYGQPGVSTDEAAQTAPAQSDGETAGTAGNTEVHAGTGEVHAGTGEVHAGNTSGNNAGGTAGTVVQAEQNGEQSAGTGQSSGTDASENPNMIDFSTCEGKNQSRITPETESGTLSVGDSAVVEDCYRHKVERITLEDVYWTGNDMDDPEGLRMDIELTNEGEGMLQYGGGEYYLTDTTATVISDGDFSNGYGPSNDTLLAPGESTTYTVYAGDAIGPESAGMPLVLDVRSELAPPGGIAEYQAARYEFDVPEPGEPPEQPSSENFFGSEPEVTSPASGDDATTSPETGTEEPQ